MLPIVGNAAGSWSFPLFRSKSNRVDKTRVPAEHVTAVTVSVKDKVTLSLGVAVGSSIVRFL